jgi:aspartate racemase
MGPAATVDFMQRIIGWTDARSDQDHVHLLVDCNPQVPDRTAFVMNGGHDPRPVLVEMAQRLEKAGAQLLVMPCNTAHAFKSSIEASVTIKLLDWPLEVAMALEQAGVGHVEVLATDGTRRAGVYGTALEQRSIRATFPDEPRQRRLMTLIDSVKATGVDRDKAAVLRALCGDLPGIPAILLACTELSAIHGRQSIDCGVPIFDAADLVARRVVEASGHAVKKINLELFSRSDGLGVVGC